MCYLSLFLRFVYETSYTDPRFSVSICVTRLEPAIPISYTYRNWANMKPEHKFWWLWLSGSYLPQKTGKFLQEYKVCKSENDNRQNREQLLNFLNS